MLMSPWALDVPEHRRELCQDAGGLYWDAKSGWTYRGRAEAKYGYPIDVDAVWEDREKNRARSAEGDCGPEGKFFKAEPEF